MEDRYEVAMKFAMKVRGSRIGIRKSLLQGIIGCRWLLGSGMAA